MKDYLKELLCFGLDIGTRTVIGVVGYKEGNEFVLVDYECKVHEDRAMMDGQIHDIQKVAEAVYEVKTTLEKRLGTSLKEVSIAAAGRSLSTQIVEVTQSFEERKEITLSDIHHLELEGVEKAKIKQQDKSKNKDDYCVAYSVVQYYLEDYIIANLEGHRAHQIKAKLIATFLPKQVIDSLYAVTERADLVVSHLTLEPIAAINASIPEQIRLLNLVLIDVGAGTSDIAITKDGSVTAYGMIPTAGDEITEAIVHKYLVDFNMAESMKIQASTQEHIQYTDILDLTHEISTKELEEVIRPTIDSLTTQIATEILNLNGGQSPNAVFCVGGGSQMLSFTTYLAKNLDMDESRVAIRDVTHLTHFKDEVGLINTPQMITPLGICMTMVKDKYSEFTFITVNDQKVQLLNAKKLTVLDAIIASGIEHHHIFPKKGHTLMFKLNGERRRIKGESGVPATILLNGKEASIHDHLQDGDIIKIEKAVEGKSPNIKVQDLISTTKVISLEGELYHLPLVFANGQLVSGEYTVLSNDDILTKSIRTLEELLDALNISSDNKKITKHSVPIPLDYQLLDGDNLRVDIINTSLECNKDGITLENEITKTLEPITSDQSLTEPSVTITVNNKVVHLPPKKGDYIFASIFDYIEFDLSKPQGIVQLVRNNCISALTDIIYEGDTLEVYWKK